MNSPSATPAPDYTIYNCHLHLFSVEHIPRNFLNKWIPTDVVKRLPEKQRLMRLLQKVGGSKFDRYAAFIYSALKEPEDIFDELCAYYPQGTKFVPLSIDFDYMGAGQPIKPFLEQLKDLSALRDKFPTQILPFVGVDPRRPDVVQLVRHYIENEKYAGIKLYPSLGFFPDDERLKEVYAYAEAHGIPVTTHCIPKNQNYYRGKISHADREKARIIQDQAGEQGAGNKDFAQYYNHPYWWSRVLEQFPRLKLNLAHFGGKDEWNKYLDEPPLKKESESGGYPFRQNWFYQIRKLIENEAWPNVYADISFTVFDARLYPLLKTMIAFEKTRDYILFGSDFYMLQKDYRERRFGIEMRGYLSDDFYWQIAYHNPRRFLHNAVHGVI